MIILGAAWLALGFANFLRWVFLDPPWTIKEILADLFIMLPLNLLFGGVAFITSILK